MADLKLVWSIRSFLDYRVPVFQKLNELSGNNLHVVFPDTKSPQHVRDKLKQAIGENAIELSGEKTFGTKAPKDPTANSSIMVTRQPGLGKKIRSLKPDVMIGDGFGQWTVPIVKRRIFSGTPLTICYERTCHTERNAQWYRRLYRRFVCRFVDAACVNGRLSKEYLMGLGLKPENITTGFMAADPGLGEQVARLSNEDRNNNRNKFGFSGIVLAVVGRLIGLKGLMETLNAWKALSESGENDATLVFVGAGELEEEMNQFVKKHQMQNVRLLGGVPYDKVHEIYSAIDVLISASLEDNWSLVVPEAMSCGIPVLNSIYNGCWPELTLEGETGWVFDPLDQGSYVAALKKCLASRSRFRDIGQKAIETARIYNADHAANSIFEACNIAYERRKGKR